jgi:Uma2 family endonuclease
VLVEVGRQSPSHAALIRRLCRYLGDASGWLQARFALEVPPDSAPEPDVSLIAQEPPPGHHPRTALLVVEVAESTHDLDRGVKAALYARAAVPCYWLIDVPGRTVEVRSEPATDGYRRCERYGVSTQLPPPVLGCAPLAVRWLFERVQG